MKIQSCTLPIRVVDFACCSCYPWCRRREPILDPPNTVLSVRKGGLVKINGEKFMKN